MKTGDSSVSDAYVLIQNELHSEFTPESIALAMQTTVETGTPVTLIKAPDLKDVAERWEKKSVGKTDDQFPLVYLI